MGNDDLFDKEKYSKLKEILRDMRDLELGLGDRRYLLEKRDDCYGAATGFSSEFEKRIEEARKRGLKGNEAYNFIQNPLVYSGQVIEKEGLIL